MQGAVSREFPHATIPPAAIAYRDNQRERRVMNVLMSIVAVFVFAVVGTAIYLVLAEDEGAVEAMIRDFRQPAEPSPLRAAE